MKKEKDVLDEMLDEDELDNPKETKENEVSKEVPVFGDPGWSDYVLSQLEEDEKFDGRPKTDGLRRFATKYFGNLVVTTTVHEVSQSYAAVTCNVVTDMGSYSGSAEVDGSNKKQCPYPFNMFPLATAETRAEGRALKKILLLSNIMTAEEAPGEITDDLDNEPINSAQIQVLENICKSVNASILYYFKEISGKEFKKANSGDCLKVIETLSAWKNKGKEFKEKYEQDWREK